MTILPKEKRRLPDSRTSEYTNPKLNEESFFFFFNLEAYLFIHLFGLKPAKV